MIGAKAENPPLPARDLRSRTGICCVDDGERTSSYMRGWSLSGASALCWSSCQSPKIIIIFNTHGFGLTVRDLERLSASSKCFVSAVLLSVVRGGKRLQAPSPDESMPVAACPASTAPHDVQRNPLNYFHSGRHVGPCNSTTYTPYLTRRRDLHSYSTLSGVEMSPPPS
jgi:hypothetical protein